MNANIVCVVIEQGVLTRLSKGAFYYFTRLKNITYTGTMAEWKNITKETDWDYGAPTDCVIHCTDGNIKLFE